MDNIHTTPIRLQTRLVMMSNYANLFVQAFFPGSTLFVPGLFAKFTDSKLRLFSQLFAMPVKYKVCLITLYSNIISDKC